MQKLAGKQWDGQRYGRFFMALLVLGVISACAAGGSYGRLQPSQEVSDMFVKGPLSPDYNYYYSGAQNKPRAIIGLDKKYTLETKRWKTVSPGSGQIQAMMDALTGYRGFAKANFGSVILDPEGKQIGVWYSTHGGSTPIKMMGDNVVSIFPPDRRDTRGPSISGGL